MLDDVSRISIRFRLDKARDCLKSAELLLSVGAYADSTNRSYYCIFHSMRAVLIVDGFSSKTHAGNITEFRRRYIKTGIFPIEFSDIIASAFETRNDSDYEDFYIVSRDEGSQQTQNARIFLKAMETYLESLE